MYQNISAALIELGLPSISGYKPLYNYQKELVPALIRGFLQHNPEFSQAATAGDHGECPQEFFLALALPKRC